ncbi:MAG: hypothetical protein LBP22_05815 [Deltaproteobacteria bacterium]|jgi:hypothetical protein|nr:hypothetical protein [Deltaproteobacteria bacterium]
MGIFGRLFGRKDCPKTDAGSDVRLPENRRKTEGESLVFRDFNFKLAVVQVLMYDKELLKPKFNVWDFAGKYARRGIDIEADGYEPIPEAEKYFQDLRIDRELASAADEMYIDGGNEIYGQIWPLG